MKISSLYYSKSFKKSLLKLPKKDQEKARIKLKLFVDDPFASSLNTHKLKGELAPYWAFSVSYSIRILFEFIDDTTVGLIDIGSHNVYK